MNKPQFILVSKTVLNKINNQSSIIGQLTRGGIKQNKYFLFNIQLPFWVCVCVRVCVRVRVCVCVF